MLIFFLSDTWWTWLSFKYNTLSEDSVYVKYILDKTFIDTLSAAYANIPRFISTICVTAKRYLESVDKA